MDRVNVAIIVLNFNGLSYTLDCLDSLRKIKKDNLRVQITVVDNNSQDGSREALANVKDINLVEASQNLGFSGGNNVGIVRALKKKADLVVLLNNDTIVDQMFLVNLVKVKNFGDIISPKIYFAPGYEFHKSRYTKEERGHVIWYAGGKIDWDNIVGLHFGVDQVDRGQFSKPKVISLATGACMMVKREVFEKIGFFDEKYFLYLEDMDFCQRAQKSKFRILFEPKSIIWHKNAGSTGGSGSRLQDYYITRNRLLFAAKYAKIRTKLAVFKQIVKEISDPIKRQALIDFLTFRFGKKHGT